MPVLETVAAVATIVSAFEAAASLYQNWKARKEASRRAKNRKIPKDRVTQTSLDLGSRVIQDEYNLGVVQVGERFQRGDGECRMQLQEQIIILQQTVIDLLQNASASGRLRIDDLIAASETRRVETVRALANQRQRMVVTTLLEQRMTIPKTRSDYFAFASNLHMAQMAERCPTSLFKGRAVLHGYRWQINERGFANIVQSPEDYVEGLVFSIQPRDQRILDRYEGVSKGYYERRYLPVQLMQCVDGPWKTSFVARQLAKGNVPEGETETVTLDNVCVYISLSYVVEGRIRAEYAERMNFGIADAVALGMTKRYVRKYLEPRVTPGVPEMETPMSSFWRRLGLHA